jgi:hypothetical protein
MRLRTTSVLLTMCGGLLACASPAAPTGAPRSVPPGADPALVTFIDGIKAVDNHSHANSVAPQDTDADALPLDGVAPFEIPVRLRPESPDWLAAYKGLYKYPHADLSDAHKAELHTTLQTVAKEQGDKFPAWVLDQVGTDVLLANRIAMGPGLPAPRFRWVSFADALMLPLSTRGEAAMTPDRQNLFPLEEKLLQRYLADLKITTRPPTLDAWLTAVITPTLEAQRRDGCVAVKFEAAYLRGLDFGDAPIDAARAIYAKYVRGGEPPHADYKLLQDFLFRYIAREAGRLGMSVHVHSFEGAGNYFAAAGADPMLLEPSFNDPALRQTNFVIVHGGGALANHTQALLWKPNVFADMSLMTLAYTPAQLARVLRDWLTQFPEKVLYGSDAVAAGPDLGWELSAWTASKTARTALAIALTSMIDDGAIDRPRAEAIATMVMRTNAARLYKLGLK